MRYVLRDPAAILGFVSAFIQMVIAFGAHISKDEANAINAVVAAVLGVLVAFIVIHDGQLAAIVGLGQAGFTLFLAFGIHLDQAWLTGIMAAVAGLAGLFTRGKVTAPVDAVGNRVPRPPVTAAQAVEAK